MSNSTAAQQGGATTPAPQQQQGQTPTKPAPQQGGAPVIRDWASF